MEKTSKYYWIKSKTDFFSIAEIDFLLSQENGCQYIVLYQMLCLLTANTGGTLASKLGEIIIPYNSEKIARDTKYFSIDTVVVAMDLFKKLNLIYTAENNVLKIVGFDSMVGSETKWAETKRKQRENKSLLGIGQKEDIVLQEIELEKDIDIDIDKEKGCVDRMNDNNEQIMKFLEDTPLVQDITSAYNTIFNLKNIYIKNVSILPNTLITKLKLYQIAIKRLIDSKQGETLEKVNIAIMDKVYGQMLRAKKIDNVEEYYIKILNNELVKMLL